jgi:uncharacterized protein YdcH (DUF465 family)
MNEIEVIRVLKRENAEFRKIEAEHRSLDEKIAEIDRKLYLTTEEEIEKKKLQKQKLVKKDRIAELVREYKKSHN